MSEQVDILDGLDGPSSEDRNYAMGLHLSGLASLFIGFGFLGPLIMWLIRKDESEFVDSHGKAALNFHLSMLIWQFVCVLLILTIIGALIALPALIVLGLLQIILPIISSVRAAGGDSPIYILALPLMK